MKATTRQPWWAVVTACLALGLSPAVSRADACDPDVDEGEIFEDMLIVFDPLLVDDEAAAIQALLGDPLYPELHAYDPPRHIPQLSAWLLRTDPIGEVRFEEIEDGVSLIVGVTEADDHWRFQTPEGVQRYLPDLTRSPTIDDFLFQPAATTIRATPSGRRWTGAGVTVAIIDTSSSLTNPITSASMAGGGVDVIDGTGTADVPSNGVDDDGDGATDESEQHGTFAAGLVHLAAPGARLLHVRVLGDDGHGDAWHVAQGIVDAVEAGADVINLSLGLTNELEILEVAVDWAIRQRGVVVVAAAGNRGSACVDRPAANDGDGVIAVAAVTTDMQQAAFTNYGREIALSAPGVDVISTHGEGLAFWSGTSFSTPLVAGGAAVLLEKYPELTPEEVKTLLQQTAQPYPAPAPDPSEMGAGVLDLGGVQAVEGEYRNSFRLVDDGADMLASWSPVAGATRYDIVRGALRNLSRVGGSIDLGPLTCIKDDYPLAPAAEPVGDFAPLPPGGFFYLLRDDVLQGEGEFGNSSEGPPRVPASIDCAP